MNRYIINIVIIVDITSIIRNNLRNLILIISGTTKDNGAKQSERLIPTQRFFDSNLFTKPALCLYIIACIGIADVGIVYSIRRHGRTVHLFQFKGERVFVSPVFKLLLS